VTGDLRAGDVAFDAPWQARAFAVGEGVLAATGLDREELRQRLIAAVAEAPARPYWDSWLLALERLLVDHGVVTADELAPSG
jgi:hypothetical protein